MRRTYPRPPPTTRERLVDLLSSTNNEAKAVRDPLGWGHLHVEINYLLDWIVGR